MRASSRPVLILHNIRSLHNVGSMLRTADAFGVARVYLSGYTASSLGCDPRAMKQVAKTALGAEVAVPWERAPRIGPLLARLRRGGLCVVALENNVPGARPIQRVSTINKPMALVVGNEVRGLSWQALSLCDAIAAIPMHGTKESLNVAVACGIALWELTRGAKRAP